MLERSKKYERSMVKRCMAGPNALYLTDELTQAMHLEKGMRVLDLGCGRGLSSVFLAREYGVMVFAVDKNEYASETARMLKDQGLDQLVFPIRAEAASIPLQPGLMDTLVCVNAYHNFGMEAGFFEEKIKPLLVEGAEVGFVLLGRDVSAVPEGEAGDNPAFWTAREWREWFESEGVTVDCCDQLQSTQIAWKEWMTVSLPDATEEDMEKAVFNPELALIRLVGHISGNA